MHGKKFNALLKVMAVFMIISLAAGCKGNVVEESYYSYYDDDGAAVTDSGASQSGNQDHSGTDSGSGTQSGPNSGSSGGSSKGKPGSSGTKIDAEKYRDTTVRYATWKNPYQNEDGAVIDSFQKKYGIKVKIDTVAQATYVNTIAGMVAAGNSPDIFFDNGFFPSSISVLQPLEKMGLDLSDPIWDQGMIKQSTLGGKPFLVNTVGNIWSEVDCVFYNKKIFSQHNITTPEEYYKAGKWNYAALTKCLTDVKNAGYIGGYVDVQSLLGAAGTGFYKLSNGKVANGVDGMTTNILTQISQWTADGLIKKVTDHNLLNNFITGTAGIAVTNAFGLKATGYFSDMNPDDIGFTYIPDYDASHKAQPTGLFRGWGLIRGAKNPGAAGVFIRYYLDTANYKTNTAFINSSAKDFFFKLTGVNTDRKNSYILMGVAAMNSEDTFDYTTIATYAPNQVSQQLSSYNNKINTAAKKVNDELAKQLKSLGLS